MAQPLPADQIQTATETSAQCQAGALPASPRLPTDLAEARLSARQSLANKLLVLAVLGLAAAGYAHSLDQPFLANESHTALAAFQPNVTLVVWSALRFDPGKPALYHILLHWYCSVFGHSEVAVRSMSVIFEVATVGLLFALGQELFGFGLGIVAALLWAFNPEALAIARLGRVYALFTALALAHVLFLSKLRHKRGAGTTALAGLLGAAMLYTHLDGVLIIAADCVVSIRELRRYGRSTTLPAVMISLGLFLPFLPLAASQTRAYLFGHWIDWLGLPQKYPISEKLFVGLFASGSIVWLTFARAQIGERSESFHRCLTYLALPFIALIGGSVILRPMFQVVYVAPSCVFIALALSYVLDMAGSRVRNLAALPLAALLFLAFVFRPGPSGPWRQIADQISTSGNPAEPVVFESQSGGDADDVGARTEGEYPDGFLRVPFDFYFHGSNPRLAVSGTDPIEAAKSITAEALNSGGAWLISAKGLQGAAAELPRNNDVRIASVNQYSHVVVVHLLRNH